jgi:hypothetical protein
MNEVEGVDQSSYFRMRVGEFQAQNNESATAYYDSWQHEEYGQSMYGADAGWLNSEAKSLRVGVNEGEISLEQAEHQFNALKKQETALKELYEQGDKGELSLEQRQQKRGEIEGNYRAEAKLEPNPSETNRPENEVAQDYFRLKADDFSRDVGKVSADQDRAAIDSKEFRGAENAISYGVKNGTLSSK